ncbi:MAG TPA: helix-turn-helix domain-containing protein [Acidimicrobiales bacterium]
MTDSVEKPRQRTQRSGKTTRSRPRRAAGGDDRNRQPRGDRRRQQILDAAVELFAAKGYRGTGVAALAERVGMTATGMLYYFGSKERLLQEVVEERDRRDVLGLDSLTLSSLRELGRHNTETALLTRLYVVLAAESLDAEDPLHDFFVQRFETARSLAQSVLEHERDARNLRSDIDVEQIAREIISVLMGLEMQWLFDPAKVDLAEAMETYFDRLLRELTV